MNPTRFSASLIAGSILALTPATFAQFSAASLIEGANTLEAPANFASATEGRGMIGVLLTGEPGAPTIQSVIEDSPAESAGFEAGDVITSIGGESVATLQDLRSQLKGLGAGDQVTIGYSRGEQAGGSLTLVLADADKLDLPSEPEAELVEVVEEPKQKAKKSKKAKKTKSKTKKKNQASKGGFSWTTDSGSFKGHAANKVEARQIEAVDCTDSDSCCEGEEGLTKVVVKTVDGTVLEQIVVPELSSGTYRVHLTSGAGEGLIERIQILGIDCEVAVPAGDAECNIECELNTDCEVETDCKVIIKCEVDSSCDSGGGQDTVSWSLGASECDATPGSDCCESDASSECCEEEAECEIEEVCSEGELSFGLATNVSGDVEKQLRAAGLGDEQIERVMAQLGQAEPQVFSFSRDENGLPSQLQVVGSGTKAEILDSCVCQGGDCDGDQVAAEGAFGLTFVNPHKGGTNAAAAPSSGFFYDVTDGQEVHQNNVFEWVEAGEGSAPHGAHGKAQKVKTKKGQAMFFTPDGQHEMIVFEAKEGGADFDWATIGVDVKGLAPHAARGHGAGSSKPKYVVKTLSDGGELWAQVGGPGECESGDSNDCPHAGGSPESPHAVEQGVTFGWSSEAGASGGHARRSGGPDAPHAPHGGQAGAHGSNGAHGSTGAHGFFGGSDQSGPHGAHAGAPDIQTRRIRVNRAQEVRGGAWFPGAGGGHEVRFHDGAQDAPPAHAPHADMQETHAELKALMEELRALRMEIRELREATSQARGRRR